MTMKRFRAFVCLLTLVFFATDVPAAAVVLNEYNAVSSSNSIRDGDTFLGQIQGNGGNWFELLIIEDQTDMRGWSLVWAEDEAVDGSDETAHGSIVLGNDVLWSNLRAGTIVTFIETTNAGGAEIDTATDRSYDPDSDDWWINVATRQEQRLGAAGLVSTTTNDGAPGDFSVGNDDWTLTIVDTDSQIVFGPVGEGASTWDVAINNSEVGVLRGPGRTDQPPPTSEQWQSIAPDSDLYGDGDSSSFGAPNVEPDKGQYFRLQRVGSLRGTGFPPGAGDYDQDNLLTVNDIDILSAAIRSGATDSPYDLNQDGQVNGDDLGTWVTELRNTWFGDANLDGEFEAGDLVVIFTSGEYQDEIALNSTWAEGDWNGDGDFNSGDLVIAFQDGGFELGPRAAANAVPEPTSIALFMAALLGVAGVSRSRERPFDCSAAAFSSRGDCRRRTGLSASSAG